MAGKHERPETEPDSKPLGNTDPSKRGRGGVDPNMGQPKPDKHSK